MVRLSLRGVNAKKAISRMRQQADLNPPKREPTNITGKPVYLPQFRIALVRTPNLSPRYAQFRVPLNFNKFDLRNYLENLYGVGCLSIRSYVQAQPITRITRDGKGIGPWRRPKSQKRMTVELKEPFVYPEEPKDLTPWEKESWEKAEKWQIEQQEKENPKRNAGEEPDHAEREAFKAQAKALLEEKETWRPTWKALGLEPGKNKANFAAPSTLPAWYNKSRKHGAR